MQISDKAQDFAVILETAMSEFIAHNPTSSLLAASEVCRFLILLSSYAVKSFHRENNILDSKTKLPPLLQKAISYVRNHDTDRISLQDLCEDCNVSKQYLIRCFKTYLQTTPNEYIIQYKISKACNLLQNSNANIQEISNELGFENQCYFSRVFTKKIGESPTVFRERVLNSREKAKHQNNQ